MPSKHAAGGCGCCGPSCTDAITAKSSLLAFTGLTLLTGSSGPSVSGYPDLTSFSCSPYTSGGPYSGSPAFNFTGGSIALSSGSPSILNVAPCSTDIFDLGVMDFYCVGSDYGFRGLSTEQISFNGFCPFFIGSLQWMAQMNWGITFFCTDNVPNWRLGVGISLHAFIEGNYTGFYLPPATSSEWTRTGTAPDPIGTYTKNGTTSLEGAQVTVQSALGPHRPRGMKHYTITSTAWVQYPTTTVSIWNPTDVIDWTGIATTGTATLS